jgi:Cu+-exporting ATPase
LQAQAVGEQTLLAQVAQAVAQAQARKASIQRVADQIAAVFVPIVVAIALLTLLGWWLATRSLADALVPAVSVLVIACPCAVGLAVPIAMLTGATRAARAGVLIRGFEALERVRRIDTLVLDKTGTLTLGTPRLVAIHTDGICRDRRAESGGGLGAERAPPAGRGDSARGAGARDCARARRAGAGDCRGWGEGDMHGGAAGRTAARPYTPLPQGGRGDWG